MIILKKLQNRRRNMVARNNDTKVTADREFVISRVLDGRVISCGSVH